MEKKDYYSQYITSSATATASVLVGEKVTYYAIPSGMRKSFEAYCRDKLGDCEVEWIRTVKPCRIHLNLTVSQMEKLDKIAKKRGASANDVMRSLLDNAE